MPQINVLYWNIQNFGIGNNNRTRAARVGFIAALTQAAQADVLCIQELRESGINDQYVQALLQALNAGPPPFNNWYFDWIKGALNPSINPVPPANYAYAGFNDLAWDAGHYEGYAVFWNQNIAKFIMQAAPPIQPPGGALTPNTQSGTCRMQGQVGFGNVWVPLAGAAVPGGGLVVPAAPSNYVIPAGTNIPGQGVLNAATPAAGGAVLPVNTVVGPGGITLGAQTLGVFPVVVPGGYTLTDQLTLPAQGSVVVPEHALSLVMFGRDSADPTAPNPRPNRFNGDISGSTFNFAPGGVNNWNWIEFTRSAAGSASRTGSRRPAYLTIRVNRPGAPAAADQLVPIIVYHAPSAAPASSAGMQRSAYSQPMYQAYDATVPGWINCNNALLGADFNVVMNSVAYAYNAFTLAWNGGFGGYGGGAAATMAIAANGGDPNNVANRSIVSLTQGVGGPPRYSANIPDFRQEAIDNIFYRGLGGGVVGGNTLLIDLLTASSAGGAMIGAPIQGCLATPNMMAVAAAGGAPIALPGFAAPNTTRAQMVAGQFAPPNWTAQNTAARRVAEFVNYFVSDHLPANIRFNM